jgi:hypothetical protein
MSKRVTSIIIALALSAPVGPSAIAAKSPKLAKCDGKQRRPANPYGSILPTVDPQNGTSTPADERSGRVGVEVFPQTPQPASKSAKDSKPAAQVPPISSLGLRAINRSC